MSSQALKNLSASLNFSASSGSAYNITTGRDDNGDFGCMSLLGCHDVCPKNLPLQTQIALLRRKMVAQGTGG